MPSASFDQILRSAQFASGAKGDDLRVDRSINITRPDRDRLAGKVKSGRANSGGASGGLSGLFAQRARRGASSGASKYSVSGTGFDQRQRAVVKIHYFNHAGGGAAGLKAHTRYVARDAATRDDPSKLEQAPPESSPETRRVAEQQAKSHATYLSRSDGARLFYDGAADSVDGAARAQTWAKSDKRHFRVILSAENAGKLGDLPAYTREVMARAGAAIGTQLQWIAVDHHDTDNPHTHIIIRGRRANGQDLVLPKDFVKHGFREIARDAATEFLGPRSRTDERLALNREVIKHAPTRLDRVIAGQLPENRTVIIARLEAPNGDPSTTLALKARARELQRIGLAQEVKRNVLAFEPDWRDKLLAMELHLDIRKRVVLERHTQQQDRQKIAKPKGMDLGR
jgi:type IV secretory pathway VirD2 relaxase